MNLNLIVLAGRLAAPPEIRTFDSGANLIRYLVTVRTTDPRRRVDVLPVTLWNPSADLLSGDQPPGHRIWIAGSMQRRFWAAETGRRSQIEIIADQVSFGAEPDIPPFVVTPGGGDAGGSEPDRRA